MQNVFLNQCVEVGCRLAITGLRRLYPVRTARLKDAEEEIAGHFLLVTLS